MIAWVIARTDRTPVAVREWYWSSMRWVYEACGGIKTTDAVAVAVAVAVVADRRVEWRARARARATTAVCDAVRDGERTRGGWWWCLGRERW